MYSGLKYLFEYIHINNTCFNFLIHYIFLLHAIRLNHMLCCSSHLQKKIIRKLYLKLLRHNYNTFLNLFINKN